MSRDGKAAISQQTKYSVTTSPESNCGFQKSRKLGGGGCKVVGGNSCTRHSSGEQGGQFVRPGTDKLKPKVRTVEVGPLRECGCSQSAAWALAGCDFCKLLGVLCLNNRRCNVQATCPCPWCCSFCVSPGEDFSGAVEAGQAQTPGKQSARAALTTDASTLSAGIK